MEEKEKAPEEQPRPDRSQLNAIENFYENFRRVPIRYLDIFIGLCVAALVVVLVLGWMNR